MYMNHFGSYHSKKQHNALKMTIAVDETASVVQPNKEAFSLLLKIERTREFGLKHPG